MKRHLKASPTGSIFGMLAVVAGLLVLAAPAFAGTVEVGTFGSEGPGPGGSGSADGQLSDPRQAAVNDSTGKLYVADTGNDRVEVFKPTATAAEYDSKVTITAPTGVAIDQATGDVYVANATGISKYDEDLTPIGSGWTAPAVTGALAVDPSSGDLLVADQANDLVRRFESDGTADGSFAAARPIGIAANSDGDILVITSTGDVTLECPGSGVTSSVQRFSAAGVSEGTVGASLEAPGSVAVDPDDDSIQIVAPVNQYNCEPFESPELKTFAADGSAIGTLKLAETQFATSQGIAVQGGSPRSYVVLKSPGNDGFADTKVAVVDEAPPKVHTIPAFALGGGTKALLGGRLNPQNQATVYWFEYGPSASYGNSMPVGEAAAAGSANATATVTQQVAGLAPNTTYHYRIVAENPTGRSVGADMTFTTPPSAAPPQETCANAELRAVQGAGVTTDCRAWEMVSPLDKNNLDAGGSEVSPSPVPVSTSGDQAMIFADGAFGDAESGSTGNGYLSTRSADGWSTHGLMPPVEVTSAFGNRAPFEKFVSQDLSRSLMGSPIPLTPDSPDGVPNLYVRNNVTDEYELVTIAAPENAPSEFAVTPFVAGVRPDFKRVVFYSPYQYTSDAPDTGGSGYLLYEWRSGDPQLTLVGILPDDGGPAPSTFIGGQSNSAASGSSHNAVSIDGSRIYFNVPNGFGSRATYLREGGETKEVSDDGLYWAASPDGSRALLVDDGTIKRYDATTETLTDLVPDLEPSDGSDPKVLGLVANSDDLSVVYFTASGKLVPGGDEFDWSRESGLYVSDDGVISQIGTVGSGADSEGAEVAGENGLAYDGGYPFDGNRETTPDGDLFVFASARRLTAYDNATRSEIYAYDNERAVLTCISCRPDGTPPIGNSVLEDTTTSHGSLTSIALNHTRRNISTGGTRIFFTTRDAISPDDTNGTPDVYVWDDGRANLVSSGVGDDREGYIFKGASPSGDDVLFSTRNRLVGVDTDDLGDIYDARVGGGFASQQAIAVVAPCEGDQCRNAAAPPPPAAGSPASREVRGSKNATPKKQKNKKHKNKHKKNKKKQQKKKKSKAGKRAQGNG